jgi:hypothetical protein
MQVLFKSRHPQATDLRDLTERRVRFVLRRLGWLVPRAEVQMSDVNGPRGGIDKRCQVELRTDGAGIGGRRLRGQRLAHRAGQRAGTRCALPHAPVAPRQ